ncbi:MAG: hypothetical protein HFE36_02525 [Clostridia bacterium]|nr:hypothetical protein [Clostridia bacterium]
MSVYIEPLLAENFILDYVIGAAAYKFLRLRSDKARLFLSALTGTVAALFYLMFSLSAIWQTLIKLCVGAAMCAILFFRKCGFVKGVAVFYAAAFIFGGCVFAVGYVIYGNAAEAMAKPLMPNAFITAGVSAAVYVIVELFAVSFHRTRDLSETLYRYRLELAGAAIEGNGFLDTGNRLYDAKTGLPVIVIGFSTIMPYLCDSAVTEILTGHTDRVFKGARKMKCGGVCGYGELWLITPDKFQVYFGSDKNILYDVTVGLSLTFTRREKEFDAILHPALTEVN